MKAKTIKAVIAKKMEEWWNSIDDARVQQLARKNTIVTGGCIASMLLKEPVNDFDVYFRTKQTAEAIAKYYVDQFEKREGLKLGVSVEDDRIRITTSSGHRGETAEETLTDPGQIEDTYEQAQENALEAEDDGKPKYRPVFLSTNAITLSHTVQLILRFYGEPEDIHKNYDFIHCTNYWASWTCDLVLHQAALESLLAKELRYVGSKYPICSLFRVRKFVKRSWTINAGQMLKMAMQVGELDLKDMKVLEDQLTGVDVAYFIQLVNKLKEKDPEKVNSSYLVEILDRMF
jgi:hypothetical protein